MRNILRLNTELSPDGKLKLSKDNLRNYYDKLVSTGKLKPGKNYKLKLNLVIFPENPAGRSEPPDNSTTSKSVRKDSLIKFIAEKHSLDDESARLLLSSENSIKSPGFSRRVLNISRI